MKLIIINTLFCVLLSQLFLAQNLVPNPGFESGTYNGGTDPLVYYSGTPNSGGTNEQNFETDIDDWDVADPTNIWIGPDSPDWIPGGMLIGENYCVANDNYYVRSAHKKESIMVKLKDDYTLVKGETYRFSIKYRAEVGWANGSGSFQVVFSTKKEGLEVQPNKKWVALDHYDSQSCEWKNYEAYFTVPTDDDKNYEEMKYLILQYNHEINESGDEHANEGVATLTWHYDDVTLRVASKCEEIKYIQDWRYEDVHKIEQANQAIYAGAHVSPNGEENSPVLVKSNAMVIYRAPYIYLEPGFFIEETGSYFETQNAPCVENPCPSIPTFSAPEVLNCTVPFDLGSGLPNNTPGLFYVWEPSEYFSAPWSPQTSFNPPTQNGCLNAQLTIWTICGEAQTFPFNLKYFSAVPTINISDIITNSNELSFELNLENTNSYTIEIINASNGSIVYTENNSLSCQETNTGIQYNFNPCNLGLCSNLIVTVTAENNCFGESTESFSWNAPPLNPAPTIQITNTIDTDFKYEFDLNIPANYEYFTVEVWNDAMSELICSNTYSSCTNPYPSSSYHFNITNCLAGCLSQCENYKIRVSIKNFCNSSISSQLFQWNKSSTTFAMPVNYPNIITLNGDGINETLCFSPISADYYYLVVTNQWGNVFFEEEGCVTENPICLWTPQSNITDGVYFYQIRFGNQCGYEDELTTFVHVYNYLQTSIVNEEIFKISNNENKNQEINPFSSDQTLIYEKDKFYSDINVYPNPTSELINIQSKETMTEIILLDSKGSEVEVVKLDSNLFIMSLDKYQSGLYWLGIITESKTYFEKIIVK